MLAPGEDTILGLAGGALPQDSFLVEYAPTLQQGLLGGRQGMVGPVEPKTR